MKAVLERIHLTGERSFDARSHAGRRFDHPYHHHPEIELTYIAAGRGHRMVGDHFGEFGPGDLVLIGADLPHRYFHPPGFDDGPKGAASFVVQFRAEAAGGLLQTAPECRAIRSLLQRAATGLAVGPRLRAPVAALMRRLVAAAGPERLVLWLEILHRLSADAEAAPLASPGFLPGFARDQADRLERACRWIVAHFREPVSLGQAAARVHMAPSAFSRFFRRATGRNFSRFVNELRVGHACRLLLETDRTVAEIAFDAGYENLSNFNRRFRELKGRTPLAYRRAAGAV